MIFMYFCLGLVVASFLTASAYRFDNEYSFHDFMLVPSSCEKCKKHLSWYELIPVLSYLWFKGRCPQCGYRISPYYPISELILGLSFALLSFYNAPLLSYFVLSSLFFLSYFDFFTKSIPKIFVDIFLISSIIYFVLTVIIQTGNYVSLYLILIIIIGYVLVNTIKKSFGLGDLLVIIYTGLLLPYRDIPVYCFLVILIAAVFAIILLLLGRIGRKDFLPLLPFIFFAYLTIVVLRASGVDLIALFWGL